MSRVANFEDFRDGLERCFSSITRIPNIQSAINGTPEEEAIWLKRKEWLECHAREFIIDHLLAGLNWRVQAGYDVDGYRPSNLAPEVGVLSDNSNTRRFLDYLGYCSQTQAPLLLVEAKRPSLSLPGPGPGTSHPQCHPASEILASYLMGGVRPSNVGSSSLSNYLTKEWCSYLDTLGDYFRSIRDVRLSPRKVLITNGEWLVLFSAPTNAFAPTSTNSLSPSSVYIFQSKKEILQHSNILFEELEYSKLSRSQLPISATQLPFVISPAQVRGYMFGLRVLHVREPRLYEAVPRITVAPVLFIQSIDGSLVAVEASQDFDIPRGNDAALSTHLREVDAAAQRLKREAESMLGIALPVRSISEHFGDAIAFALRPATFRGEDRDDSTRDYILMTGEHTHFLVLNQSYHDCRYHGQRAAHEDGVAPLHAIRIPSVHPKAFFPDQSPRHCAHRSVYLLKEGPLTGDNRGRCGSRSAPNGGPFCEIWSIDTYLCCRACVYQDVCTSAETFRLPCRTT